jgi:hypothetical protein
MVCSNISTALLALGIALVLRTFAIPTDSNVLVVIGSISIVTSVVFSFFSREKPWQDKTLVEIIKDRRHWWQK